MKPALILLDRDGVLNAMVINPDHGTIDSPMHPSQVKLLPGVREAVARLYRAGYILSVVSNQPAAAKGKTTKTNLINVHNEVITQIEKAEVKISSSHICFHRAEEDCSCRKPKTGLLEEAFKTHQECDKSRSWMVGDGLTDIQAGKAMGLKCAFLAPRKCDACKLMESLNTKPEIWVDSLPDFVRTILSTYGEGKL